MRTALPPLLLALLLVAGCRSEPGADGEPAPLTFTSDMVPQNVVSGSPEETSNARASATATLEDRTLSVGGTFSGLSSPLRDLEETPDDPGVHIHPGAEGEENSYLYGLGVTLNPDERSGTFSGRFELEEDEVALLLDGRLYLDIHTVLNDPGEVRDQLRPEDPLAARRAARGGVASIAVVMARVCPPPSACVCSA